MIDVHVNMAELRAEVGQHIATTNSLREALVDIADNSPDGGAVAIARAALGLEPLSDEELAELVRYRGRGLPVDVAYTLARLRELLCTDGPLEAAVEHLGQILDDAGVHVPDCDRSPGCPSLHLTLRIHALASQRDGALARLGAVVGALDLPITATVGEIEAALVRLRDPGLTTLEECDRALVALHDRRGRIEQVIELRARAVALIAEADAIEAGFR